MTRGAVSAIEDRIAAIRAEVASHQECIQRLVREESSLNAQLKALNRKPLGRPRIQYRHGNSAGYNWDHCRCAECRRWNRERVTPPRGLAGLKKRLQDAHVFTKEEWAELGSDRELEMLIASQRRDMEVGDRVYVPPTVRSLDAVIPGTDGLTLLELPPSGVRGEEK